MGEHKTPGVYIKEKNAFGNSVVEAETAIPAFIGFTEKALNGTDSLLNKPWKISSMTEFINYFGGAPKLKLTVDVKKFLKLTKEQVGEGKEFVEPQDGIPSGLFVYVNPTEGGKENVSLKQKDKDETKDEPVPIHYALYVDGKHPYSLYYNMLMFFANGGGPCYVVSIGTYDEANPQEIGDDMVGIALNALKLEREVTMIVVPEAATSSRCANIQQKMMMHCGEMANRIAILDVPQGNALSPLSQRIENFQNTMSNYLSYGAAYYPWLNTTVLSEKDIEGDMLTYTDDFILHADKVDSADSSFLPLVSFFMTNDVEVKKGGTLDLSVINKDLKDVAYTNIEETAKSLGLAVEIKDKGKDSEITIVKRAIPKNAGEYENNIVHAALFNGSPLYAQMVKGVVRSLNCLPPSAAMVGIYTMVDSTRGVWKAPANVGLNYVSGLTETIGDEEQQNLNVPINGKAINVIRAFRGEGNKVWGARTLDGNSQDWRYINVRRTMMFLEESVRNAARAYVFEPNDANTWINMKCMIGNFLRSVWKRGGLAGATPEEAFEVHVGLGDTMTGDDILEGIMRITVLVAVTRPAEFIEITFQQQMQKS